jgi:hypothetical protein
MKMSVITCGSNGHEGTCYIFWRFTMFILRLISLYDQLKIKLVDHEVCKKKNNMNTRSMSHTTWSTKE